VDEVGAAQAPARAGVNVAIAQQTQAGQRRQNDDDQPDQPNPAGRRGAQQRSDFHVMK
jgi:hypothetical protein